MNISTTSIDIHSILTFHVTATSPDILDIAIHGDITACRGQVLNITVYLYADDIALNILASDSVPIDGLTIGIPMTIDLFDGVPLMV